VVGETAFDAQVAQVVVDRPLDIGGHLLRSTCAARIDDTVIASVMRPDSTALTASSNGNHHWCMSASSASRVVRSPSGTSVSPVARNTSHASVEEPGRG